MNFPVNDYLIWVRFRESDIYKDLADVYTNKLIASDDASDILLQEEKLAYIKFFDDIWNNVLAINNGLNDEDLNYLLFTHLLILNSEAIFPDLYKKYNLDERLYNPLRMVTNTSDGSTSVSTDIIGKNNLSMLDSMYLLTKWGILYKSLLSQINQMIVVL